MFAARDALEDRRDPGLGRGDFGWRPAVVSDELVNEGRIDINNPTATGGGDLRLLVRTRDVDQTVLTVTNAQMHARLTFEDRDEREALTGMQRNRETVALPTDERKGRRLVKHSIFKNEHPIGRITELNHYLEVWQRDRPPIVHANCVSIASSAASRASPRRAACLRATDATWSHP
jgi:hypothetical protein